MTCFKKKKKNDMFLYVENPKELKKKKLIELRSIWSKVVRCKYIKKSTIFLYSGNE